MNAPHNMHVSVPPLSRRAESLGTENAFVVLAEVNALVREGKDIAFMAMHGRGLICVPLTEERCEELRLPQMVRNNTATLGTAIKAHKPGENVSVTWSNQSGSHTATVNLGAINP